MSSKKKKKKRYRVFWFFIRLQVVLMVFVVACVAYYYLGGYAQKVNALHDEAVSLARHSSESTFRSNETSLIYAADGTLLSTLKSDKDMYYLEYDEIPQEVIDAFVSIEDKKFYSHKGVDYKAFLRAAYAAVRNGKISQGGSTITMQLARNVFLSSEVTWERKVEEIFLAMELEKLYSKQKIMEYYVNNIYFANGYYGIEAASKGYFSKSVSELSLAEITFLCAIPNRPTLYDPLLHPENTLKRSSRILEQMYEDGYISRLAASDAQSKEIFLNPSKSQSGKYSYAKTYAIECAIRAMIENSGFETKNSFSSDQEKEEYEEQYDLRYNEYQKKLYTGGYRIYTSINLQQQELLQQSIDDNLSDFQTKDDDGIYEMQGSAVCIDNLTGYVTAIVGGRSQETEGLNRAYQSVRQPGSSIKPLIVYTPCLERGYTPDSIVEDKKIEDGPSNADGVYSGEITLRTAVAKSKNSVAYQLFEELTPEVGLQYLLDMNFSKISDDDYRLTSALGGMTYGASAEEMAAAYATINNDGIYRKASCVRQITDSQDNVVYENGMSGKQVYTSNASRMMTDMLGTVMESGTGKNYCLSQMPCAGKTGTTNDNKDGWFVGYTYYYTTSVWVGYDMPRSEEKLKGGTYPAKIWHDYMEQINDGLAPIDFKPYAEYDEDYDRLQDMVGEDETEDEPEDEPEVEDEPDEEEEPDETQTPEPVPEEPVPEESSSGDAGR